LGFDCFYLDHDLSSPELNFCGFAAARTLSADNVGLLPKQRYDVLPLWAKLQFGRQPRPWSEGAGSAFA
jgi:hypothetical protein